MSRSFLNTGSTAEFVGQTPWSARVPLDPQRKQADRASAADRGVRPTIGDRRLT